MADKTDDSTRRIAIIAEIRKRIADQQTIIGQLHQQGDHDTIVAAERLLLSMYSHLNIEEEMLVRYQAGDHRTEQVAIAQAFCVMVDRARLRLLPLSWFRAWR